MKQNIWTFLTYAKIRKDPLITWQFFMGDAFPGLRAFLKPCPGEFARSLFDKS